MRITSRIAYKNIIECGKASNQKRQIIKTLLSDKEPMSRREIASDTYIEIGSVSGRVNELLKLVIVEEAEMRRCSISKKLIKPVKIVEGL